MGWSPDQKYQVEPKSGTNALWLVDVTARRVRLLTANLNTITGRAFEWIPDSRPLLVTLRPANAGAIGPNVQQAGSSGRVTTVRTY